MAGTLSGVAMVPDAALEAVQVLLDTRLGYGLVLARGPQDIWCSAEDSNRKETLDRLQDRPALTGPGSGSGQLVGFELLDDGLYGLVRPLSMK
jgi:hypothetical protein